MFEWAPSPEIFSIGPVSIRWYSLMFVLSFAFGFSLMKKMVINDRKPDSMMDSLLMVVMISTIVGARLGHCFFYDPVFYLSNPIEILKVWEGGLASHGAAIGILAGLWWFAKRTPGITFLWIVDRVVVVVALAGMFIRIGNFFNSEILGHPWDGPFSIVFSRVDSVARHPVQLYEAIAYGFIFIFLFISYWKFNAGQFAGRLFGYFLTLIFGVRILLETFKTEQASFNTDTFFTMGQWLSVPFVIAGIWLLIQSKKKESASA